MVAASCSLDEAGLSAQLARYRAVGDAARLIDRQPRRIVLEGVGDVDREVEELIAVERECCPFFELEWDPEARRFSVAVAGVDHEPGLDAIAYSLGLSD